MQPLISVIVPIYNVEPYLERCVNSILNQSYINLEIILVNDGSPDKCGKICDELSLKDNRIKVIHKVNGGLSDARNAGLDIAKGDFIGFVDSDDYIHPEMYTILYNNMIRENADLSICDYKAVSTLDLEIFEYNNTTKNYSNMEALEMLFTYYCQVFVIAWNKLYKKEVFEKFRYEKGKIHEDEFLTYKILHQSKKIVFSDARLYYYFQSPNSIIRTGFNVKKLHYAEAMEERIQYFEENNLLIYAEKTIRSYILWLLNFYYINKAEMSIEIKQLIIEKIESNCKLYSSKPIGLKKLTYLLSVQCPYWFGFCANQSIFGLNIVAKLCKKIF